MGGGHGHGEAPRPRSACSHAAFRHPVQVEVLAWVTLAGCWGTMRAFSKTGPDRIASPREPAGLHFRAAAGPTGQTLWRIRELTTFDADSQWRPCLPSSFETK